MGFPSIWYDRFLLPLINIEAVLAYDREEYRQVENPDRDTESSWSRGDTILDVLRFLIYLDEMSL